jgi:hypothetical protein
MDKVLATVRANSHGERWTKSWQLSGLTVMAKDGRSHGERWTKSWRKSRLTVLAKVRANSPGETKNSLFIRSAYKNSICFSFYECFMACISSQIKSNGYQNYFDVIIFCKTSFLHDWIKTTELQKGLIHTFRGTKKHHALNQ